jgi:hypothetical protein
VCYIEYKYVYILCMMYCQLAECWKQYDRVDCQLEVVCRKALVGQNCRVVGVMKVVEVSKRVCEPWKEVGYLTALRREKNGGHLHD